MKRLLPIILIALTACNSPKVEEFTINGTISGDTPEKAYLKLYQDGKLTVVDSADLFGGEFTFDGAVDFPTGTIDSLANAKISGSSVQLQYEAYQELKKGIDNQSEEIYKTYKETTDDVLKAQLIAKLDSLDFAGIEISKQYVKNNPTSVLAPFIIQREIIYYLELQELDSLTNSLSPELANYHYTKDLNKRIDVLKTVQPGMIAPDFTQNDKDGNPINLSDFKGKVVLVDFWASWCGPCRRANPTVVAMFKKYSSKGFTILGISMDNNRDKWLAAIEADGLTWSHVSTLEGWANPVGKLYGVNSIPHAVLINRDGTIIKRGVNAEELDGILEEIFK